jgi:transposase
MLYLGAQVRYFYFSEAIDMRKGYYGMSGIVRTEMKRDVLSGDVFVFMNKRYNKIKLLQWDKDGFAIHEKHLEKGTFERPSKVNESSDILLTHIQLQHILQGIIMQSVRQKKRYERMS